jgi:hypothetical protein
VNLEIIEIKCLTNFLAGCNLDLKVGRKERNAEVIIMG